MRRREPTRGPVGAATGLWTVLCGRAAGPVVLNRSCPQLVGKEDENSLGTCARLSVTWQLGEHMAIAGGRVC